MDYRIQGYSTAVNIINASAYERKEAQFAELLLFS
jgi:hypothetical protein